MGGNDGSPGGTDQPVERPDQDDPDLPDAGLSDTDLTRPRRAQWEAQSRETSRISSWDQPAPGYWQQPADNTGERPIEPTELGIPQAPWIQDAPPRRHDPANIALYVALAALLIVVAGGVVVFALLHSSSSGHPAAAGTSSESPSPSGASPVSSPAGTSASAPGLDTQQASSTPIDNTGDPGSTAAQINTLLDRSAAARSVVAPDLKAIHTCRADESTVSSLQAAATTRRTLLGELDTVDFAALDNGSALQSELADLLTYSADADDAYGNWGTSYLGCFDLAPYEGDYTTGQSYSMQATAAKKNFLSNWNPVAEQYGLPTRSESGI